MKVSVLMPVYNAASFLHECVDSILNQTHSDWELLAVNDFSQDESFSILQSYAQKDNRIKVFDNQEKGIISALRLAFASSTGDLISRMDADDRMAPVKLEKLSQILQKNGPGSIAVAWVDYFSDSALGQGYQKYAEWLNALCMRDNHYEEIYKECVIPSPCWMVHRADLIRCGAFEGSNYPEDYDLCFRFYREPLKVVAVQEVLHFWRDHATRASRNDPHYAVNQFFDLKVPYFKALDFDVSRPLVLWGAGKKGKYLARLFKAENLPFTWICNTPTKWGKSVEGMQFYPPAKLEKLDHPQVIIAVAAPEGQAEILAHLKQLDMQSGKDYFLFC
jgi:glycosyltransferase involved in cell wall biosynthesis